MFWAASGAVLLIALLETSYKMAYHDELTQLPSRRALNEALLKLPDWYTVAMVDVDHFKKFNDTYGHAAGDQALRLVASRLAGCVISVEADPEIEVMSVIVTSPVIKEMHS